MIGNMGVHFEDAGYAVTEIDKTIKNLIRAGYKKVAITGLSTFSAYEDVLSEVKHIKESNQDLQLDIIPGIQCYFEEEGKYITLIAKDYEGYLELSKIITEANELGTIIENPNNQSANHPVIYMDNLRRNIKPGHMILNISGQNNVFSSLLSGDYMALKNDINSLEERLSNLYKIDEENFISYDDIDDLIRYYDTLSTIKRPLKKEYTFAERYFKETDDSSLIDEYNNKLSAYEHAKEDMKQLDGYISELRKIHRTNAKYNNQLLEKMEALENYSDAKQIQDATSLYLDFEEIFGKDNICFELQSHNNKEEKEIIEKLTEFAYSMQGDNPNFVVGNETRIGVLSNDNDMDFEIMRLGMSRFLYEDKERKNKKDNIYVPINQLQPLKEYCIKTEDELQKDITNELKDKYENAGDIVNKAIKRTDALLNSCYIEPHEQENHYPKYCDDENSEFEKRCIAGISWRFPNGFPSKEYEERLQYELNVIKSMGYAGYHLIVQDYLEYSRLLGYLTDEQIEEAPLTIPELEKYIEDNNIDRIGVGIGPGRGSAVGSLCCYLLGITDVDPIEQGLLFERFLNTERVSMPDIDSDFAPTVRYKAIDYVKNKYGAKNICQIMTKQYDHEKGSIRDANRYIIESKIYKAKQAHADVYDEEIDDKELEKIKKECEKITNNLIKEYEAYEKKAENENLQKGLKGFLAFNENSLSIQQKNIINHAIYIDNMFTGYGKHAAGVIISKDCVGDAMPLMLNSNSKMMQTQCQMASAEEKGYLKMDFLGLRNLSVITDATKYPFKKEDKTDVLQNAAKRDIEVLKDKEVYEKIFSKGLTQGVFQFESAGMKNYLKALQPESFDDIVLLNAAYRPGPMDFIPEIIERKKWEKGGRVGEPPKSTISLRNDTLDDILKNTYGCPIYQEQIMQIFQRMAGYSLGRADEVRRAMSKKKEEKLAKERENFIYGNAKEIEAAKQHLEHLKEKLTNTTGTEALAIQSEINDFKIPKEIAGCVKLQGITAEEANKLFDQMMPFAKYGFNKSHAVAYSVVAVETAWLKLHRTKDFYCSALNHWKDRNEVTAYAAEMSNFDIKLLPPRLDNKSAEFTVEEDGIRFPIIKANNFDKNFNVVPDTTLQGFIKKNPELSQTRIESLIKLGCFDACWDLKEPHLSMEKQRIGENRHAQINWLKTYYKTVNSCANLEISINSGLLSENDVTKKQKELNDKLSELMSAAVKDIKEVKIPGQLKVTPLKHSISEIFEERKWEFDFTCHTFGVDDDFEIIKKYSNHNNYDTLMKNETLLVNTPCVVLSVSDEQYTKTNKLFYNIQLMDRNGNIFFRRMQDKPTVSYGIFALYNDDKKFLIGKADLVADEFEDEISFKQEKKPQNATVDKAELIQTFMSGGAIAPIKPKANEIIQDDYTR